VVLDINLGCSAFTHGLWATATLLPTVGRRALLVNVDTMSRTLGADDWGNQVLFGDAAAVTAFEVDATAPAFRGVLLSDGKGTESVCLPDSGMSASPDRKPKFIINGPAVLGLALRSVPKIVQQLLESSDVSLDQVGLFVPHQANVFILDKLADRLKIDPSRMIVAMAQYGNTSSASIPLALCSEQVRVAAADRERTMMIGFGTGFSLSGVIADLRETQFVAPVDVE
jgi:3-oxoacyl-[acyl-carrier-protein] synthase-3